MAKHQLNLAVAITRIKDELAQQGLEIRCSTKFKRLRKTVKKLPGKTLTQQFSLDFFDLHGGFAYWFGLYDQSGNCVCIIASRTENLGRRPLAEHWRDQQSRIYPKPNRIGKNHAPLARKISGRVAYHGDFWVHPDWRGGENISLIVSLCFFLTQLRNDPDWIYGLMGEERVKRGFLSMCGFDYGQPYGTDWLVQPETEGLSASNWLVASEREGIHHRAHIIASYGLSAFQKVRKT